MDIRNKVAVVTGGASGLGEATVERLIADGARVAIFDLNTERGEALAEKHQGSALFCKVNVADEASAMAGVAAAKEAFGAIHVCVNCAGVPTIGRVVGRDGPHPYDEFKRVIDVNLNGTFNICRLTAAEMLKNEPIGDDGERGVIVNTSSMAGIEGQMGQSAYAASKAGIIGLMLPMTRDLAQFGVRVSVIAPGLFETPLVSGAPEKVRDKLISELEFPKRMGAPSEFASLVAHIVQNPYINGELIRLDGGVRARPR
jgi:NAD(P)-dependent dehydrogenase (short-subunit alcohol dehydrogenase family)